MGVCDSTTIVNLDVAVCALQSATAAEQRKMMTWSICTPFSSPFVERERVRRACAFPIRDICGPAGNCTRVRRCFNHNFHAASPMRWAHPHTEGRVLGVFAPPPAASDDASCRYQQHLTDETRPRRKREGRRRSPTTFPKERGRWTCRFQCFWHLSVCSVDRSERRAAHCERSVAVEAVRALGLERGNDAPASWFSSGVEVVRSCDVPTSSVIIASCGNYESLFRAHVLISPFRHLDALYVPFVQVDDDFSMYDIEGTRLDERLQDSLEPWIFSLSSHGHLLRS